MNIHPTDLTLQTDHTLVIKWSDGSLRRYDPAQLRRQCPCATCKTEQVQTPASPDPQSLEPITILQMRRVGNYAYNILFSDGHGTGIFSLEMLRELGMEEG